MRQVEPRPHGADELPRSWKHKAESGKAEGSSAHALTPDLHERAHHPASSLKHLHGSLFELKCTSCSWQAYDERDPLPGLELASASDATKLLDHKHPLDPIPTSSLPRCPECGSLARPAVVWFGESLDSSMLAEADAWIEERPVDIVLVVGTSAVVYPAAGYSELARSKSTAVVTVNLQIDDKIRNKNDMHFAGDAASLLPQLLEPLIGKL